MTALDCWARCSRSTAFRRRVMLSLHMAQDSFGTATNVTPTAPS